MLTQWCNRLTELFGRAPIIVSGGACSTLPEYPRVMDECLKRVDLARRFGRVGVIADNTFGAHALLLSASPPALLSEYANRMLASLNQYDEQHRADLVHTLRQFLSFAGRYQQCADAMNIHVSTLRYRIDRIHELTDLDLSEPECRFELELALRIQVLLSSATEVVPPAD
jgi:purine catabolism regulator